MQFHDPGCGADPLIQLRTWKSVGFGVSIPSFTIWVLGAELGLGS